jgi:hypothetical protein
MHQLLTLQKTNIKVQQKRLRLVVNYLKMVYKTETAISYVVAHRLAWDSSDQIAQQREHESDPV